MDRCGINALEGQSALDCAERREISTHSTKRGKAGRYCWWTVFLLQILFVVVCSNAKQCTRMGSSTFVVLGVFDDNDTASIRTFHSTLEEPDKGFVDEHGCPRKVQHRELLLHNQTSAIKVINATRHVLSGDKVCYVIYSSYAITGRLVLDYAINNGIPVVSTIPKKVYNSRDEQWQYVYDPAKVINLNERSSRSTKMQVILEFLSRYDHKEFVAITGADFDDMSVVSLLRQELSQHNLVMVDWFIIPNGSYHDVANRTREKMASLQTYVTSFLMITNDMLLAETIVNATNENNLRKWILASDTDFDVIVSSPFPTLMSIIYPVNYQVLNNSDYVDDAIGMLRYFAKEWIVNSSGRCPSIGEIQRHLPNIAFHGKTGFVKFSAERERLRGQYNISDKRPSPITEVGNFNGSLNTNDMNQGREELKIVIVEYAPYIMIHPKIPDEPCEVSCFRAGEKHCCSGFVIDVINQVTGRLDILPKFIFNEDGIFGKQEKNGSWMGVVNDIMTGKADMSPALFPSSTRVKVLDFTEPYMPSGIALLVKESKRQERKIHWTTYMRPFTAKLWYVFIGSVGVIISFLWIVEKFSPSKTDNKLFHWHSAFCLDNAVCYVLQLAFGRPADEKKPRTNGARLTALIFGVAMMILMASYSANLAAFLIVDDMTTPVNSIRDEKMVNPPPDFKYGTLEGSYMAEFFKTNEDFRKMWHHMEKNNVKTLSDGVKNVQSGELDVFIGDSVSLQYIALSATSCELKVVGVPFAMSGPSFAVKKGSKWSARLSVVLRRLKSKDLTAFIQKFWVKKFTCTKKAPPETLHLKDLSGLFLQLLIAILLCVLGTSCRLVQKHYYKNRETENNTDVKEDLQLQCTGELEPLNEEDI